MKGFCAWHLTPVVDVLEEEFQCHYSEEASHVLSWLLKHLVITLVFVWGSVNHTTNAP